VAKFRIIIDVEGFVTSKTAGRLTPRVIQANLTFPKRLKKIAEARMAEVVKARTLTGRDANGQPFAPLKDGEPTDLKRTGRMLDSVQGWTVLKIKPPKVLLKAGAIVVLGVVADLGYDNKGNRVIYPYIVHYGKNRGASIQEQITYQEKRVTKAQRWLNPDNLDLVPVWRIKRATESLQDAQRKLAELRNQDPGKIFPGRPWFGMLESQWDVLSECLQDWVDRVIRLLVLGAFTPADLKQVQKAANKDFEQAISRLH